MKTGKNTEQKPEVAFFVFYTSIFYCGPWRNSVRLWMEKGYNVSVFQIADQNNRKHKPMFGNNFVLNEIKGSYLINFFRGGLDRIFRLFNYLNLAKLGNMGSEIGYVLAAFYFCAMCYFKTNKNKKYILIGGDPPGLLVAYLISRRKGNVFFYWSLELWIEKDLRDYIGQRTFKRIEKWANRKALCTVEFGDNRCELLRRENNLSEDSMISIPNSPLGEAKIERNYYFNDKFGISKTKKIILYAGGMADFYSIEELLKFVDLWPTESVLVLHDRLSLKHIRKKLQKEVSKIKHEVHLNTDPVGYDRLHELYSSCDIGLQVWKPVTTNLKYPGLSSGKIFHWLQAGVPVIVRNLDGYKEFVEGNRIGICLSDLSRAGEAIVKIFSDEMSYRENCIKTFNRFRFESYHKHLIDRTEKGLKEFNNAR